jgi:hypothetical protein
MTTIHEYYHTEGMTDLSVLRSDAQARLDGKGTHAFAKQESIIHLHPKRITDTDKESPTFGQVFDIACYSKEHEAYNYHSGIYKYTLEEAPPFVVVDMSDTPIDTGYVLTEVSRDHKEIVWRIETPDRTGQLVGATDINVDTLLSTLSGVGISCETVEIYAVDETGGSISLHISMDIRQ